MATKVKLGRNGEAATMATVTDTDPGELRAIVARSAGRRQVFYVRDTTSDDFEKIAHKLSSEDGPLPQILRRVGKELKKTEE